MVIWTDALHQYAWTTCYDAIAHVSLPEPRAAVWEPHCNGGEMTIVTSPLHSGSQLVGCDQKVGRIPVLIHGHFLLGKKIYVYIYE